MLNRTYMVTVIAKHENPKIGVFHDSYVISATCKDFAMTRAFDIFRQDYGCYNRAEVKIVANQI